MIAPRQYEIAKKHNTQEQANDLPGCLPLFDLSLVQTNTERLPVHMLGKTR